MRSHLCFTIFLDSMGELDGGYLNTVLLSEAAPELAAALADPDHHPGNLPVDRRLPRAQARTC